MSSLTDDFARFEFEEPAPIKPPARATSRWAATNIADLIALAGAAFLAGLNGPLFWSFVAASAIILTDTRPRRERLVLRAADEIVAVVLRLALAGILVGLLFDQPSRQILAVVPVAIGLVVLTRVLVYKAVSIFHRRGLAMEPVVVVGAGMVGQAISEMLSARPEFGLRPVGFVDSLVDADSGVELLGRPSDLKSILDLHGVRHVLVAFGGVRDSDLVSSLRQLATGPYVVHLLPRFFELTMGIGAEDLWGYPIARLRPPGPEVATWPLKRALDLIGASLLSIVFFPVLLVCAAAVRLSSPGPVFFRQVRVGMNGEAIEVVKFRTMRINGDSDTTWSVDNDDRVTSVGRILRPTHLDELPQLLNVLRGEMSLVGPRPERPVFVEQFTAEISGYTDRLRVKAGLTGWAQVHGLWGDTSIKERARFDNRYIDEWTLWKDLLILLRTVPTLGNRRTRD